MKAVVINKKDLRNNIKIIKEIANKTNADNNKKLQIIAVVKANGYGLGLVKYSKFLVENEIDFLAVATLEEALTLRKAKIKTKILMLSPVSMKKEVDLLIKNDIILTVSSKETGSIVNNMAKKLNKKIEVHLKIDTGFGRYGFCYNKKQEMIDQIKKWKNLKIIGTYSHFSLAFYEKDRYSKKQFTRFMDCIEELNKNKIETGMLHICNSSAFLKYENMRLDAVRIGSAFLGRLAIPNEYGLKKIAELKSSITEIKTLPKGYNIGYSNSYITKKETTVAIIPVGYADGFNIIVGKDMFRKRDKLRYIIRDIKDSFKDKNLYVKINNSQCRVLGRIGMYHTTVDITEKNVKINDKAIFNISPFCVNSNIRREYR